MLLQLQLPPLVLLHLAMWRMSHTRLRFLWSMLVMQKYKLVTCVALPTGRCILLFPDGVDASSQTKPAHCSRRRARALEAWAKNFQQLSRRERAAPGSRARVCAVQVVKVATTTGEQAVTAFRWLLLWPPLCAQQQRPAQRLTTEASSLFQKKATSLGGLDQELPATLKR